MNIAGLQKLTLLDFPGKTACTVFTSGCNLRCPYCHNASLALGLAEGGIPEEEFFGFLKKRRGLLDGVCITGGEPLMQRGLEDFILKIKSLGFSVKLDTNGFLPERLSVLINSGAADYVAMDIKSSPQGYPAAAGIDGLNYEPVARSIKLLLSGKVDYEFRTTVVKGLHTPADIESAAKSISGARRYFLQSFSDSGDLISGGWSAFSGQEMKQLLKLVSPYVEYAALRGVD